MAYKLNALHFERLSSLLPDDVCRRTLARFNPGTGHYTILCLGTEYRINPEEFSIEPESSSKKPVSAELALLILIYLIQGKNISASGRWVNEHQIRGGAMFFRGPHAFPTKAVADRFGRNLAGFREKCHKLSGIPMDTGDAAFRFQVLPRVPALAVFWYGDDEFDADFKLLFDSSIENHLPLDVIFGLSLELCGRIAGKDLGF